MSWAAMQFRIISNATARCFKPLLLMLIVGYVVMSMAAETMFRVDELCEIPDTSGKSLGPLKYPGFNPEAKSTCAVHCNDDPECKAFLYTGKLFTLYPRELQSYTSRSEFIRIRTSSFIHGDYDCSACVR